MVTFHNILSNFIQSKIMTPKTIWKFVFPKKGFRNFSVEKRKRYKIEKNAKETK
jgi:hypothetical protein